jgi:hypothetical protein
LSTFFYTCKTTTVQNNREQWISICTCSEPVEKVISIYDALKNKYAQFIQKKSVVPKPQKKKMKWLKIILLWMDSCKMG